MPLQLIDTSYALVWPKRASELSNRETVADGEVGEEEVSRGRGRG